MSKCINQSRFERYALNQFRSWGDEIDLFKNGLCSKFYIVNACAQAAFLVGDVMLLTMAFKKVKRNGGKPAVQNLVYVCNINVMFMSGAAQIPMELLLEMKSFGNHTLFSPRNAHFEHWCPLTIQRKVKLN